MWNRPATPRTSSSSSGKRSGPASLRKKKHSQVCQSPGVGRASDWSPLSPQPGDWQTWLCFFFRNDAGPDRLPLEEELVRGVAGRFHISGDTQTFRGNNRNRRNKLISAPRQGDDIVVVAW